MIPHILLAIKWYQDILLIIDMHYKPLQTICRLQSIPTDNLQSIHMGIRNKNLTQIFHFKNQNNQIIVHPFLCRLKPIPVDGLQLILGNYLLLIKQNYIGYKEQPPQPLLRKQYAEILNCQQKKIIGSAHASCELCEIYTVQRFGILLDSINNL